MNDYFDPNIDPTNPQAALRSAKALIATKDFITAERILGWALDFNPDHAGLLRCMSRLWYDRGALDNSLQWAERALASDRGDPENYACIGLLRARQCHYADASDLLTRALEIEPDNTEYLQRLAEILTQLGQGSNALTLAQRSVDLRPSDVRGHLLLAKLQKRFGSLDDAETTLRAAIVQAPDNASLLRQTANLFLARGDIHGARRLADRALEIAPDDAANRDLEANIALISDDLSGAETALIAAVHLSSADGYYKRRLSNVLMRQGKTESAFIWATKAIVEHPDDLLGHNHLASLRMGQGQYLDAYEALEAAVTQAAYSSDAAPLMRRLSHLAQQIGRREQAHGWAERAVAADPLGAENHAYLAKLYLQQGEFALAHNAAERAVCLSPGQSEYSRRLSEVAWQAGDAKGALQWAGRATAIDPNDAQNYLHQSNLLIQQGQSEAAEPILSRAVELAPSDANMLSRLSDLKQRLGKKDEALSLAERAIGTRPVGIVGYIQLATLHVRFGNLEEAEVALRQAADIEPNNATLLRRLADVAQRRRDNAGARYWLDRAVEADSQDPQNYNQLASFELACGDALAAEVALVRATELAGSNPNFHRRLSDMLARRGDEPGALHWAEIAVREFPNDPAGLLQLGVIHLAADRLDDAEKAFLAASELAATSAQKVASLHRLSDVAIRRNDAKAALTRALKAVDISPFDANAHSYLAGFHLSFDNLIAAEQAAQRALAIAPTDVSSLRRLSTILLRQGRVDEALPLAHQAVLGDLNDLHSHIHEANLLLVVGDYTESLRCIENALQLAPSNANLLRRAEYLRILSSSDKQTSDT